MGAQERRDVPTAQPIQSVHDRLRDSRALTAPKLLIQPPEALGRAYTEVTVVSHRWHAEDGHFNLQLKGTDDTPITVVYSMDGKRGFPVVRGRRYRMRIFHPTTLPNQRFLDEEPTVDDSKRHVFVLAKRRPDVPDISIGGLKGWALVIRTPENALVGALFSGRWQTLEPSRNTRMSSRASKGLMLEVLERLSLIHI